ncbi:hypothetical protein [Bacteroides gallinaceum]|uniref:hypothetical protein n=1 Tax=Bacteroides gallinaceum TaxID=1462571 RepID=UPI0015B013B5|nr:hypothetical protein [Bacteroides gallinaceum]MDM8153281.1 hypothetical protein [Bacteroides gallinaceum]
MKIKKYLFGLGIAMTTLFASCETDNEKAIFEEANMGVAFEFAAQDVTFPANGYEGFDVEIVRAQTAEAATVPLTATMADGSAVPAEIQVPSEVSFEAGEGRKTFHVTVGDIESGMDYNLNITVDPAYASSFEGAVTTKTITIYRDYTYSPIGTGHVVSAFAGGEGDCEFEKADNITWYRAIAPYEEGYNLVFQVQADGKTVVVTSQPVISEYGDYGEVSVAGQGELVDGVITVSLEFTVSAGSFGIFEEVFTLPAE